MTKIKVKILKNWKDKLIGLSGKKVIYSIYFETRFGIHTLGMKKPIDVFILDKHSRVMFFRKELLPNNFFFWNPIFYRVLEIPSGKIKLKLYDQLKLVNTKV